MYFMHILRMGVRMYACTHDAEGYIDESNKQYKVEPES